MGIPNPPYLRHPSQTIPWCDIMSPISRRDYGSQNEPLPMLFTPSILLTSPPLIGYGAIRSLNHRGAVESSIIQPPDRTKLRDGGRLSPSDSNPSAVIPSPLNHPQSAHSAARLRASTSSGIGGDALSSRPSDLRVEPALNHPIIGDANASVPRDISGIHTPTSTDLTSSGTFAAEIDLLPSPSLSQQKDTLDPRAQQASGPVYRSYDLANVNVPSVETTGGDLSEVKGVLPSCGSTIGSKPILTTGNALHCT